MLGRAADVTALGVEYHRHGGVLVVDVGNQCFELVFGAACSKVGNLRLEGAGEIGGGVGNLGSESVDGVGSALQMLGELRGVWIETDTEQGVVLRPRASKLFAELSTRGHFQVSFSVTVRLNAGAPGLESTRSATK